MSRTDLCQAVDLYRPSSATLLASFGYRREPEVTVEVWRHQIPETSLTRRSSPTPEHPSCAVWVLAKGTNEDTTAAVAFVEHPAFHLPSFSVAVELSLDLRRVAFRSQTRLDRLGGAVDDALAHSPLPDTDAAHTRSIETVLLSVPGLNTAIIEVESGTRRGRGPAFYAELPCEIPEATRTITSAAGSLWLARSTDHRDEHVESHFYRAPPIEREQFIELVTLTHTGVPFDWAVSAAVPNAGPCQVW